MADPERDQSFLAAYTAVAGELSNTYGSSSGTPTNIATNGAVGIIISVDAVSLPGSATELRITPKYYDGTTYRTPRSDGTTADYVGLTTTGMLPPYPVSADWIRLEPWLDAADSGATCTITVTVIYE